jgi:hypothetical protein
VKQIIRVSPLTPIEAAQIVECEKALGVSRAVYEQRQREYIAALNALAKKYDADFEKNSKSQITKYAAIVKDGCIVISLE